MLLDVDVDKVVVERDCEPELLDDDCVLEEPDEDRDDGDVVASKLLELLDEIKVLKKVDETKEELGDGVVDGTSEMLELLGGSNVLEELDGMKDELGDGVLEGTSRLLEEAVDVIVEKEGTSEDDRALDVERLSCVELVD